jgi:hypothetical protein
MGATVGYDFFDVFSDARVWRFTVPHIINSSRRRRLNEKIA